MKRVLVMSLVVCSAAFFSITSLGLLLLLTEGAPANADTATPPGEAQKSAPVERLPANKTGPLALNLPAPAGASTDTPDPTAIQALTLRLAPLQKPLSPPRPGEWLSQHNEPGQTFQKYLTQRPVHARGKRRVLYVQPVGYFDKPEKEVLHLTARFLSAFYCLPVKVLEPISVLSFPRYARRTHPYWGDKQLLAPYIFDQVLKPILPGDAASMLGLTPWDLWPGDGWNFVFGMASLRDRVGVWSTYRNGDLATKRNLHLLRTFKIASHETGHMFSIRHCTAHKCGMAGSNSRPETDRHPLTFCPHCLAKLLWATGCDARKRFNNLAAILDEAGLKKRAARYRRLLKAINL